MIPGHLQKVLDPKSIARYVEDHIEEKVFDNLDRYVQNGDFWIDEDMEFEEAFWLYLENHLSEEEENSLDELYVQKLQDEVWEVLEKSKFFDRLAREAIESYQESEAYLRNPMGYNGLSPKDFLDC